MTNKLFYIFIFSVLTAGASLAADDSMQMYEKDAAKTVFGKDVVVQVARFEDKKNDLKTPEDSENKNSETQTTDNPADSIIAKYGDPLKKFEVEPKADAPKPFQAMIEALKVGDKELAYKYAVQYTRYMQDLESINNEVVGVQGKAMEKLGIIPKSGWTTGAEFDQYNELLNVPLTAEEAAKNPGKKIETDAKALLKQAQSENDLFFKPENATPKVDATVERAAARKELAGLLPTASKGLVDVYFFFDVNNNNSVLQGRELQKLFKGMFVEHEVKVVGFDIQGEDPIREDKFRKDTGAAYEIVSGRQLAQIYGISATPAVAFVNRETGKTHIIRDYKSSEYLSEALLMTEEAGNA